jgi:hypothetical protein
MRMSAKSARPRGIESDAGLERMIAEHIHCGEPMRMVGPRDGEQAGAPVSGTAGTGTTYRCFCGFTLDQPPQGAGPVRPQPRDGWEELFP